MQPSRILFIINPSSGSDNTDWKKVLDDYFKDVAHEHLFYELPGECKIDDIKKEIKEKKPQKVVAVGGDGTVKLAAEALVGTDIPLGILPAGSANGLAKELNIPADGKKALDVICSAHEHSIHLLKVNDEWCIHLSDIGFNAYIVKEFENQQGRGMWNYIKASFKVLFRHSKLQVSMEVNGKAIKKMAVMIVLANGTSYGTGALINPKGKIDDELFEVIVIKKISLSELFKMIVTHKPFNPAKTELFQTKQVSITSKHKAYFQVDGEYLGKINKLEARLYPKILKMIY
jgi:diacylglycerol kinase (ATP)